MLTRTIGNIHFRYSEEVADALAEQIPIIALESNVITHGFDYPENVHIAHAVEDAVYAGGAVPATIGIDDQGVIIGMSADDIERLATGKQVPKVSSRDLGLTLGLNRWGATTVASSLILAEMAGLKFFSSAGIGGVHRQAQTTMDISSDLIQFTRSKLTVVCAGAKTILDIGLTLEFLETHSVPVVTYQSEAFPGFYCRASGVKSPCDLKDLGDIAKAINAHWTLGGNTGFLVATPIDHAHALDNQWVEALIDDALQLAASQGITGNGLTKFLMRTLEQKSEGKTAEANREVLISTAHIAAKLAVAYYECTPTQSPSHLLAG